MTEVSEREKKPAYGRTAKGQLLYDLVFTDLKPSYLKTKHRLSDMTAEQIADLRQRCKAQIWPKKFKAKKHK